MAAGRTARNAARAAAEDTALLGSNRSAVAVAIRHERHLNGCRSFRALGSCRRPESEKSRGAGTEPLQLHLHFSFCAADESQCHFSDFVQSYSSPHGPPPSAFAYSTTFPWKSCNGKYHSAICFELFGM